MARERDLKEEDMQQLAEQMEKKGKGKLVELFGKVAELPEETQKVFVYTANGFVACYESLKKCGG